MEGGYRTFSVRGCKNRVFAKFCDTRALLLEGGIRNQIMNENSSAAFRAPSRTASVVSLAAGRTGTGTPSSIPVKRYLRFCARRAPPLHPTSPRRTPPTQSPFRPFSSSWRDDLRGENQTKNPPPRNPREGKTKINIKRPKTS